MAMSSEEIGERLHLRFSARVVTEPAYHSALRVGGDPGSEAEFHAERAVASPGERRRAERGRRTPSI
jgi:hypothetical protein